MRGLAGVLEVEEESQDRAAKETDRIKARSEMRRMDERYRKVASVCKLVLVILMVCSVTQAAPKTPVILDTDIGDDIDDSWALVMLLKSPQLDLKLITTTNGQPEYRARLLARFLTIAGRTDVPIGLGAGTFAGKRRQEAWVEDLDLAEYQGKVEKDGVQAMIRTIKASPEPVTLIAIGPLQTVAAALERDPSIAGKVNFVGMDGSVFKGYGGAEKPAPEWNVKCDVAAAKKVFSAKWKSTTITPLDTCGLKEITLAGERFTALKKSDDKLVKALLESYAIWASAGDVDKLHESTLLYDTVAVYLADSTNRPLIDLQKLRIAVTDEGMTVVSPLRGADMNVATKWNDVEAYRDHLVKVLRSNGGQRP